MTEKQEEMQLVYDGKCPVCTVYCTGLLKETKVNNLKLVDARQDNPIMNEINAHHLDIDEGMVLKVDGKLFYGTDAIYEISKRNRTNGFWGWTNRIFFSSKILAGIFYPLGKLFRNAVLRLKGIEKIRNLEKK
jgi:predicted DCC family thiol-disulfide oxidoreductase YuxK